MLTEVSDLAGQLREPARTQVLAALGLIAMRYSERYFPSREAVRVPEFTHLGLADVTVLLAAREDVAVLTDDLPLYLRLASLQLQAVNFNHIRRGAWT